MIKDILPITWNVPKDSSASRPSPKMESTYSKLEKSEFTAGRKMRTTGIETVLDEAVPDSIRSSELRDKLYEVFVAGLNQARYSPTEEAFLSTAFTYLRHSYPDDEELKKLADFALPLLFIKPTASK